MELPEALVAFPGEYRHTGSDHQISSNGDDEQGYITWTPKTVDDAKTKRVFQCTFCDKRYERLDHVKRHIKSHENTRPFKCKSCARRFNRRDLLARHQIVHDAVPDSAGGKSKRADRVIQACQACTAAKTKCDDRRPCRRCEKRGVSCIDTEPTRRAALLTTAEAFKPASDFDSTMEENLGMSDDQVVPMELHEVSAGEIMTLDATNIESSQEDREMSIQVSMQSNFNPKPGELNMQADTGPVDVPGVDSLWDTMDWQNINFQADLAHIYQDLDFRFDNELPSLDLETWASMETPTDNLDNSLHVENRTSSVSNPEGSIQPRSRTVIAGHEAFKKSPWLWTPSKQDHAYSSHSQLAINEAHILASPEVTNTNKNVRRPLPHISDPGARDEMLPMVIKFSKSTLKIRSFPSHSLLNVLMQAFFVRDSNNIDSCIHSATFQPDQCRTELLAGLVSAGSTLFATPNIWKMGLALQDVVKLAICDALDDDNRLARDLETNQTFLIWIEVGLWSGFRRKMEIAEGFAHTVPTMLRRAGAFHQSHYASSPIPTSTDEGDVLHQKWLKWVELESLRRLVFRIFMNEMRTSIAFVRSPVFSGMELTLALPSVRALWEAQNAEEWKKVFLAMPGPPTSLSLIDGLHDSSALEDESKAIDLAFSAHAILYALWGRIWALAEAKSFHQRGPQPSRRATTQLWLEAQHQELYSNLKNTKAKLERLGALSPEARLLCELLMMSLHSSSADIQSLAGRFGEREFKHALPQLRDWAHNNDSFVAIWHAGQVLRAARLLAPTSLRGFLAIAVYHASLLLWVAVWLSKKSNAPSRASPTPENANKVHFEPFVTQSDQPSVPGWVVLDGPENAQVRSYLSTEKGRPALQLGGKVADLADVTTIPEVMVEIFRQNFPSQDHPLPPLLENLVTLMEELSQSRQVPSNIL